MKYLVYSKIFTVEINIWKKKKDLENTKKAVVGFEKRISAEVRQQKKLNLAEERDFRRRELLEKYIAKILYR